MHGDHSAVWRCVNGGQPRSAGPRCSANPFSTGAPFARASAAAAAACASGSGGHGSAAASPTMLRPVRPACVTRYTDPKFGPHGADIAVNRPHAYNRAQKEPCGTAAFKLK